MRSWQIGFLAGIIILTATGFVIVGNGTVASIVTLAGLLAGIANALLAKPDSTSSSGVVLDSLKKALNVSWLLKTATVLCWTAALVLGGVGILRTIWASDLVNFGGIVLQANGTPAANATVTVGEPSDFAVTGTDGVFVVRNLSRRKLAASKPVVNITWNGFHHSEPLNLAQLSRPLPIRLPPDDVHVRFTNFEIGDYSLDFLAKGDLDPSWEPVLGKQPIIVKNEVLDQLVTFTQKYQDRVLVDDNLEEVTLSASTTQRDKRIMEPTSRTKLHGQHLFVGAKGGTFGRELSERELRDSFTPPMHWSAIYTGSVLLDADSGSADGDSNEDPPPSVQDFHFWRHATRADISADSSGALRQFYLDLTSKQLPQDFAFVGLHVRPESGNCGDDKVIPPTMERWLELPSLSVTAILIENVTGSPVRIGNAQIEQRGSVRSLVTLEEHESSQPITRTVPIFPLIVLKPGERILVPLSIRLKHSESDFVAVYDDRGESEDGEEPEGPPVSDDSDQIFRKALGRRIIFPLGRRRVTFPASVFKAAIRGHDVPDTSREFVSGISWHIANIDVDGQLTPAREVTSKTPSVTSVSLMVAGKEVGSCPFVYSASVVGEPWELEGSVLVGRTAQLLEGTDVKPLRHFAGVLRLSEEEDEVSYIDFVQVVGTDASGRRTHLDPDDPRLTARDGNYVILNKGEKADVAFDLSRGDVGRKYFLVIHGYYRVTPYGLPAVAESH